MRPGGHKARIIRPIDRVVRGDGGSHLALDHSDA